MAQASYVTETKTIRKLASDPFCRWKWTKHALEMMARFQPAVTQGDVQNALMKGQVILVELITEERWRVKGPDLDGNFITVIVEHEIDQPPLITVVTVF